MEQLTSKDLMVGDWVGIRLDDVTCTSVKIAEIHNWGVIIDWAVCPSYKRLEPIPITPEILKKNGFKKDTAPYAVTSNDYISNDKRIIINNLSNSVDKDWFCLVDNEDFRNSGSADIQYVHELQHLFRLCGIDKDIEL